jgi:hypothetical protein
MLPDTSIATVTLVRGAAEERVVRESLTALSSLTLPLVVVDGGSSPEFVRFLATLPNTQVARTEQGSGLVGQARLSLRRAAASGRRRILYTEPDKDSFFRTGLQAFLVSGAPKDAAVVLASRSPQSFLSYPATQQSTERMLNSICAGETGLVADYSYGPFLVKPALVHCLDAIPASLGWGWRTHLFVRAHRLGFTIGHVEADFPCPINQRVDSDAERHHRVRQFAQNLAGVVWALEH